ncbi:MAG: NADH oxidase [Acidocella sp. 20-63-7]|nr:MAG: NADH oxidase [Acidocella sp. 20-63-7]HQT45915.1 benzoate 1,2-dioxygenase electron transfer component BenC [Acidocella sp.]
MSYNIALNFEDGVTRFITCASSDTVADASYRAGINIPLDCRDGACGTCKSFCETGTYDGGAYIEDALTNNEAAQGYVLTCQMKPRSDLVLRILAPASACKAAPVRQEAQIESVTKLSATTLRFALKLAAPVPFLAGQYVNILVPGSAQTRAYSFSSAPGAATAEFLVRNIRGGLMSSFLTQQAQPGTKLSFIGPVGSFFLREVKRPVLLLAGGTGLAPLLSMLGQMAAHPPAYPVHLIYGVTNDEDLVEIDRIEKFAEKITNFTWSACVANEAAAYPQKGYVTRHIQPMHLNDGDVDVYLCGPPPMVEAVRKYFAENAIQPTSFHYEKFAPSTALGATA